MGAGEQLHASKERHKGRSADKAVVLGEVLRQLMAEQVGPRQERFGEVAEVWGHLLPSELLEHCEIAGVSGGQLRVRVDSPSHMYELQLCGPELQEELQRQCPRARIKRIKFVVA